VFCTSCGDAPYRQFLSSAADEDVYNGTGNPMPGKLREGEIPFFVVGRLKIRSTFCKALINNFAFFNGSSFTLAVILTSSVLVRESSFLDLVAFHFRYTIYSSVRSGYFSAPCDNGAQFNSHN